MQKNGILTFLFAFIPGAGQMYQGYMKRGLSLIMMCCAIGMVAALISPAAFFLIVVWMYSFFDTFNLRAQIATGTAPADDYLVHFDPKDKRLVQMMLDSHKLVGWTLIAFGVLIAYENILMNALNDLMWRWGKDNPFFRAFYLVMDQLPQVVVCVALIICGIWLVKGPKAGGKPEGSSADDPDFHEYRASAEKTPEFSMPAFPKLHFPKLHTDDTATQTEQPAEDESEADDGNDDA